MHLVPFLLALYFAYGSNLSYDFLKERLKNGEWLEDGWHRSGVLEEPIPKDLGVYVLDHYTFIYNLDGIPFGEEGTAANIVPQRGGRVYGALYEISECHLQELDKTESVPIAYRRVAVHVHRLDHSIFSPVVQAWAYVGNPCYFTSHIVHDPYYIDLILKGAEQRRLPREYINRFLKQKVEKQVECLN